MLKCIRYGIHVLLCMPLLVFKRAFCVVQCVNCWIFVDDGVYGFVFIAILIFLATTLKGLCYRLP